MLTKAVVGKMLTEISGRTNLDQNPKSRGGELLTKILDGEGHMLTTTLVRGDKC